MIRRLAEYRVREGEVGEALDAIREFVEAIARVEPETGYHAFRRQDGRDFVHLMTFKDQDASSAHATAAHTRAFVARLRPLCEKEPSFTDLHAVGTWTGGAA